MTFIHSHGLHSFQTQANGEPLDVFAAPCKINAWKDLTVLFTYFNLCYPLKQLASQIELRTRVLDL